MKKKKIYQKTDKYCLKQVESKLEMGDSLIQKITVEVANGKRAEDTSNNSIPE